MASVPLPWCTSQSKMATRWPLARKCGGGDGDVVQEAKAHRAIGGGVMAGRTHEGGAVVELATGDEPHEVEHAARGQQRRRPRAVGKEGVGIEEAAAALADGRFERVEIIGAVHGQKLGARGRTRGDAATAGDETGVRQRALDGDEPLRTLRMLARRHMVAKALVGEKAGSHARQYSIRCRAPMLPSLPGSRPRLSARVPTQSRASLVIALVGAAGYLALAPSVVNGDGLGYLKAALAGTIYPGHVAYVPLLWLLAKVTHATRPMELLWPARALSAAAAATAALALGAMDEAYHKHHMWALPRLKMLPSEYFRAHGYASFQEDPVGLDLAVKYNLTNNFLWANDYPHHEGSWPHSAEAIEREMGGLPEDARAKILGLNAARLFKFDVDALTKSHRARASAN